MPYLSAATTSAPPARTRRSPLRRWLRRLGLGLGALIATCLVVLAVPPARDFAIGQIIYQGDFFFPARQASTVIRYLHPRHGQGPIAVQVPVRNGTTPGGGFISRILHGQRRTYRIYLPPGYDSPANRHRRYPVLYLIHGSPGNPASWLRGAHADYVANEEIAAGSVAPLIMVMPDMNGGPWKDTECVDKWDGTDNEMRYFAREMVPYIDAHYRTVADRRQRGIGGLSSGGYCAYNIAFHYPRLFGSVFSISGYFQAIRGEVFGINDPFGHNPRFIAANSPDAYVGKVRGVRSMHLFIVDSTADYGYTGYALRFDRELMRLHIPHLLLLHHPSGFHLWDHSWAYWHSAFREVLPAISASFGHHEG